MSIRSHGSSAPASAEDPAEKIGRTVNVIVVAGSVIATAIERPSTVESILSLFGAVLGGALLGAFAEFLCRGESISTSISLVISSALHPIRGVRYAGTFVRKFEGNKQ